MKYLNKIIKPILYPLVQELVKDVYKNDFSPKFEKLKEYSISGKNDDFWEILKSYRVIKITVYINYIVDPIPNPIYKSYPFKDLKLFKEFLI